MRNPRQYLPLAMTMISIQSVVAWPMILQFLLVGYRNRPCVGEISIVSGVILKLGITSEIRVNPDFFDLSLRFCCLRALLAMIGLDWLNRPPPWPNPTCTVAITVWFWPMSIDPSFLLPELAGVVGCNKFAFWGMLLSSGWVWFFFCSPFFLFPCDLLHYWEGSMCWLPCSSSFPDFNLFLSNSLFANKLFVFVLLLATSEIDKGKKPVVADDLAPQMTKYRKGMPEGYKLTEETHISKEAQEVNRKSRAEKESSSGRCDFLHLLLFLLSICLISFLSNTHNISVGDLCLAPNGVGKGKHPLVVDDPTPEMRKLKSRRAIISKRRRLMPEGIKLFVEHPRSNADKNTKLESKAEKKFKRCTISWEELLALQSGVQDFVTALEQPSLFTTIFGDPMVAKVVTKRIRYVRKFLFDDFLLLPVAYNLVELRVNSSEDRSCGGYVPMY